jgi:Rod binding domain-containing protein
MTPPVPPLDLLAQAPAASPHGKTRADIERTAKQFEAAFISQMLGTMFQDMAPAAPFGGGSGEEAFKSFLMDAIGKQMASTGGLGLADDITREMLRMQGLD